MSLKILFCDNSLRELLNFRGEVIKYYASQGYNVVLVAPPNRDYPYTDANIKYIPVNLNRSGTNLFQDWLYFTTLRKIYKAEKPDYIFHYTIKPNIYGTLAARSCKIPTTAMIAGLGYMFNKKGIGSTIVLKLYKFALRFSEYVFVLNASNKQFLEACHIVPASKSLLLTGGEGVNLKQFTPFEQETKSECTVFLMIARLLYDKGYSEYVEAARVIKQKYSNVEFHLLGAIDTVYPNHVPEEKVKQDHDDGVITYWGFSSDVISHIQIADSIVLPSYYNEGLSRVLMEACAMGKPIITTDIPGCKESVEDGVNGYIVPPRNYQELASAFEKFINMDKKARSKMGEYGRKKAEKEFDISHVIDVYKKITTSVCI